MDNQPSKNELSRRDFLNWLAVEGAAVTLAACAPTNIVKLEDQSSTPEASNHDKELENVKGLYLHVNALRSVFGQPVIDWMPNCVTEFANSYEWYVSSGNLDESIDPDAWGKDIPNTKQVIDAHLENDLFNNVVMCPAPADRPDYVPPEKSEVEGMFRRIRNTFPAMTMCVTGIAVAPWQYGGGYFTSGGGFDESLKVDTRPNSIVVPDPRVNEENNMVTNYHELGHAVEINFRGLKSVMKLEKFSKIPLGLVKYSAEIAKEWFEMDEADGKYKKYGLRFDDLLDQYDEFVNGLGFLSQVPSDALILESDGEETVKIKKIAQLMLLCKRVGKGYLTGSAEFVDTDMKRSLSEHLMGYFFSEATHYLVGPYQVNGGKIPASYSGLGLEGIHKFNLEMHKIRMEVFANADLGGDPMKIRESLGLPVGTETLENFGAEYLGIIQDWNGNEWKVHKLPEPYGKTVFFVGNPEGEGSLVSDQVGDLNLDGIRAAAFDPQYSWWSVEKMNLVKPFVNLNLNNFEKLPNGVSVPVFGTLASGKIKFFEGDSQRSLSYFYDKDETKVRLYLSETDEDPKDALVFIGEGKDNFYNRSVIVTTNGQTGVTSQEIFPNLTGRNTSLRIIDLRDQEGSTVTVGDVDKNGQNGRVVLKMSEDVKRQIGVIQSLNPATKVSIEFGIQGTGDNLDLQIILNVYPNSPDMKQKQTFLVEGMRVLEEGDLMELPGRG